MPSCPRVHHESASRKSRLADVYAAADSRLVVAKNSDIQPTVASLKVRCRRATGDDAGDPAMVNLRAPKGIETFLP